MKIKAYRICHKEFANSAFSGEGARLFGGRWNAKGVKAVYLADSAALATLEIMVHINDQSELSNYNLFEVSFNHKDVIELNEQDLPSDWADSPIPNSTVQMGSAWLQSQKSAILKVPTVVIKAQCFNYILNISHPKALQIIKSAQQLPYDIDARLKT